MVALFFRERDDHHKWLQIEDNSFSVHFNVHTFFFLLCPFPLDWVDKRMVVTFEKHQGSGWQ